MELPNCSVAFFTMLPAAETDAIMSESLRQPKDVLKMRTETGWESLHYSVFYKELPDQYKLFAQQKLGETDENRERCMRKLREFAKKENISCMDDWLVTVLRCCKYNVRKAQTKLKKSIKSRRNIIEKLCRLDEKKINLIIDETIFTALPYRDNLGRAVLVTKPSVRFDLYSMEDIEPVFMSFVLFLLSFPMTTVCGISYIAEARTDSIYLFYTIAKGFKNYIYYAMDLPLRVGRVDVTHENFICRLFFNAVRPILSEKLNKRVHFNGNTYSNLHELYHKDMLPAEFEGNLGPIDNAFYKDRLLSFIQKLKAEVQTEKP